MSTLSHSSLRSIALLWLTILSTWSAETATAPRPFCFVFAGESNSGGFGLNKEANPAELAPRPTVQIMNLTSGKFEFENLQIGVNKEELT